MPAVFAFAVVARRRERARFFPVHDDAADEVRHHRVIEQEDEDGLEKAGDGDANDTPPSALNGVPRNGHTTHGGVRQAEEDQEGVRGVEMDAGVVVRVLEICQEIVVLRPRRKAVELRASASLLRKVNFFGCIVTVCCEE